jgi:hypothetical protein
MLLFKNTTAPESQNLPLATSDAGQSANDPHLNAQQLSEQRTAGSADASEERAPSPSVPATQSSVPASLFDSGVRASQLLEFCRHVHLCCNDSLKFTLQH